MKVTFNGLRYRFVPNQHANDLPACWSHIGFCKSDSGISCSVFKSADGLHAGYTPLNSNFSVFGMLVDYDIVHVDLNTGEHRRIT